MIIITNYTLLCITILRKLLTNAEYRFQTQKPSGIARIGAGESSHRVSSRRVNSCRVRVSRCRVSWCGESGLHGGAAPGSVSSTSKQFLFERQVQKKKDTNLPCVFLYIGRVQYF